MSELALHAQEHHPHHPFLQHHFEDMQEQHEASMLGMWMFLATEILFFGGFFCAYTIYRILYYNAFRAGAHHQNWQSGAAHTASAIVSELPISTAVFAAPICQF